MRIELDANSLGCGCKGLEIGVLGFQSNPTDAVSQPSQVFLGDLRGAVEGSCLGWLFPGPDHKCYPRPGRDQQCGRLVFATVTNARWAKLHTQQRPSR